MTLSEVHHPKTEQSSINQYLTKAGSSIASRKYVELVRRPLLTELDQISCNSEATNGPSLTGLTQGT